METLLKKNLWVLEKALTKAIEDKTEGGCHLEVTTEEAKADCIRGLDKQSSQRCPVLGQRGVHIGALG